MAIIGVGNYSSVYENTYASSRKRSGKKKEDDGQNDRKMGRGISSGLTGLDRRMENLQFPKLLENAE